MKLYLVRHGKAHPKSVNPERSLTEEGKREVFKVASLIGKEKNIELANIFQSSKVRAKETVEIIVQFIQHTDGIIESEDLKPMADPSIWVEKINKMNKDIMLVGHLPQIGRLASLLLTKGEEEIINFAPATIVCLSKEGENFSLEWIVSPEI
jgi:phosphohistidine phosphatase